MRESPMPQAEPVGVLSSLLLLLDSLLPLLPVVTQSLGRCAFAHNNQQQQQNIA